MLCHIAAHELGVSLSRVEIHWGDTHLPAGGPAYGSSTTMSAGSAVALAARDALQQLARLRIDVTDTRALRGIGEIVGGAGSRRPGAG